MKRKLRLSAKGKKELSLCYRNSTYKFFSSKLLKLYETGVINCPEEDPDEKTLNSLIKDGFLEEVPMNGNWKKVNQEV